MVAITIDERIKKQLGRLNNFLNCLLEANPDGTLPVVVDGQELTVNEVIAQARKHVLAAEKNETKEGLLEFLKKYGSEIHKTVRHAEEMASGVGRPPEGMALARHVLGRNYSIDVIVQKNNVVESEGQRPFYDTRKKIDPVSLGGDAG